MKKLKKPLKVPTKKKSLTLLLGKLGVCYCASYLVISVPLGVWMAGLELGWW